MSYKSDLRVLFFILFIVFPNTLIYSQSLSDFDVKLSENDDVSTIVNNINFNGYTNYWQDNYTQWHRYGNLFKIALPDLQQTILQSKVDIAKDLGLSGFLMQEGFLSLLFDNSYAVIENPVINELESLLGQGNTLVITDPATDVGRELDKKATGIFKWAENLPSHQFGEVGLKRIKAFYLVNGNNYLFVISSSSQDQVKQLQSFIN